MTHDADPTARDSSGTGPSPPAHWMLGDLRIDLQAQVVLRSDERLEVAGLSFQLLRYLLARGTAVVGFDELIAGVWAPAVVNEETVTQRVKLLRQALGDDGRNPRYVRSVRGQGYQLCQAPMPVQVEAAATGGDAPASLAAVPDTPLARLLRWHTALVGLLALVAIGLVVQRVANMPASVPAAPSETGELLQRADYYAGIGQRENNERAITLYQQVLERVPGDVRARHGLSLAYSARVCRYNFPPAWAERAQAMARELVAERPADARAHAALGYAADCLGRIEQAIAGYEKAVELDPVAGNTARASAAYLIGVQGRLARALELNLVSARDPATARLVELQIARVLELLGYAGAAEARYVKAFRLNPDEVFTNAAWPRFLYAQGRLREAEEALQEAQARGTAHVDLSLLRGEIALVQGDRALAARAFRAAAELRPHNGYATTLVRLVESGQPDPGAWEARIGALQAAIAGGDRWPENWLELALIHDVLGRREAAIGALGDAVAAGWRDREYLRGSPLYAGLRGDPGFARVIDEIARRVAAERADVESAAWLPQGLL